MLLIQLLDKMGRRLCGGDFSFLPMLLLVSSLKDQSKQPKSLQGGGQCLNRVIFCPNAIHFSDFNLKPTKYFIFLNSQFV